MRGRGIGGIVADMNEPCFKGDGFRIRVAVSALLVGLMLGGCGSKVRQTPPLEKPVPVSQPAASTRPNFFQQVGNATVKTVSAPVRWMTPKPKPAKAATQPAPPPPPEPVEGVIISRFRPVSIEIVDLPPPAPPATSTAPATRP